MVTLCTEYVQRVQIEVNVCVGDERKKKIVWKSTKSEKALIQQWSWNGSDVHVHSHWIKIHKEKCTGLPVCHSVITTAGAIAIAIIVKMKLLVAQCKSVAIIQISLNSSIFGWRVQGDED